MIEKLLLRIGQSKEEDNFLLVSEDIAAKCYEVEKRLNLNASYFPFAMMFANRMLDKGFDSLFKLVGKEYPQIKDSMINLNQTLYTRYFSIIRKQNIFEKVSHDARHLEIFRYRENDKDRLAEDFSKHTTSDGRALVPPALLRPYLPFSEYVKVSLNDVVYLLGLMKFEHHQRFMLSHYIWNLNSFIQILVEKFKDDISDYGMISLKKSLGFKDLLTSDYSFNQFISFLGLSGMSEESQKNTYLSEEEYFKAISMTYGQLSYQASEIPLEAFREDKYVKVAENCGIVLSCFESVKLSFNLNLQDILIKL